MSKPVLLVVDDEQDIVEFVQDAAEEFGFEVVTAKDGRDCLKKIPDARPDVLLLDVMMPDMDGVELVQTLADQHLLMPIIIMSGHEQLYMHVIEMLASQSGIEILGTLSKPFHIDQLEHFLAPVLERKNG